RSLRPLAIRGELSKPVSPFYMEISTIGKFEKELGRGMASAPITFGHL
ncbi:TPA: bacteriocin immunity protein, partial [Enterococcus faecium]